MTLILTELSRFGIAMAADSVVTHTSRGHTYASPNAAEKLQIIPTLNAGISCWGLGQIAGKETDKWLEQFIKSNSGVQSLGVFAETLASALQSEVGPSLTKQGRLGFHLAGFERYDGKALPSFYHIHDGTSTTLQDRGIIVDPSKFNANHDVPPVEFMNSIPYEARFMIRNGDYRFYAQLFGLMEDFFRSVERLGIVIPHSQNLDDRAEYLVFQIRTISDLYRMSNLVPGIGGEIKYLTISAAGIQRMGVAYHH